MEGEKIFRTSLLGFNKEDVIEYIAQMRDEFGKKMDYENKYLNRELVRLKKELRAMEEKEQTEQAAPQEQANPAPVHIEYKKELIQEYQSDLSSKVERLLKDNEQLKREIEVLKEKSDRYIKLNNVGTSIKASETLLDEAQREAEKIRDHVRDYVKLMKDEFDNSRAKLYIDIQNKINEDNEKEKERKEDPRQQSLYNDVASRIIANAENNMA